MNTPLTLAASVERAGRLLAEGKHGEAEAEARAVLAKAPDDFQARVILNACLQFMGRFPEAIAVAESLVQSAPNEPAHLVNLGTARRGAKQDDAALAAYARASELGAAGADFSFNVALVHLQRNDFGSAYALLEKATQENPLDAEIRVYHAQACYDTMRFDQASRALAEWQTLQGLDVSLIANIAMLLMNLGEMRRAEVAMRQVRADKSAPEGAVRMTVLMLERTNQIPEAREVLDRLLANPNTDVMRPEHLEVEGLILQREGKHSEAVKQYTRALPGKEHFHLRYNQLFPIARSLDALGRYDEAWRVLMEAHASQVEDTQRRSPQWTFRAMPNLRVTELACDPADVALWDHAGAPATADSPVFVVGFPRSGTTLLELALDAHPQLKSMDEQRFVQDALDDLVAAGATYPSYLRDVSREALDEVRANYWARVARKVKLAPGERLVDKNPLNILRLPVMRRVFPNARILLAVRHPCDVILSCYMQAFRSQDFALLCRSIESLANGFRRSFDYWYAHEALVKPAVHEFKYEDLVGNFESGMRAITDFLELPWDEKMLRPAERAKAKGFISTPSYSQVTQPVNRKSVDRWRRYEKYFSDALPPLVPYFERWGYAGAAVNSK